MVDVDIRCGRPLLVIIGTDPGTRGCAAVRRRYNAGAVTLQDRFSMMMAVVIISTQVRSITQTAIRIRMPHSNKLPGITLARYCVPVRKEVAVVI